MFSNFGQIWGSAPSRLGYFLPQPPPQQKNPRRKDHCAALFAGMADFWRIHVDFSRSCGQLRCGNWPGHSGSRFARSVSMVLAAGCCLRGAACVVLIFAVVEA